MNTLCRILQVKHNTYYKHYISQPADRTKENQVITSKILNIYAHYHKRLGAYKIIPHFSTWLWHSHQRWTSVVPNEIISTIKDVYSKAALSSQT